MSKNILDIIKNSLSSLRINYRGERLSKKYVIIESDDWGAIRTPSKDVLEIYGKNNVDLSNSIYKYDTLETEKDFEMLFDVLNSVRDKNGNPAILTANTIVGNPDFEKIKASNYTEYYYEPFTKTYNKYKNSENAFKMFEYGIGEKFILPQFHGREHLNISRWLQDLQKLNKGTLLSFDLKSTYSCVADYSYMEAFDWDVPGEIDLHKVILNDGLKLFEELFKFSSVSFIPPCYNFDPRLYDSLYDFGIKILQGMRVQLVPTGQFNKYKKEGHYFWERIPSGLRFNIRNVHFEPVFNHNRDWINKALLEIYYAFLFNKPATICSHRVNYVSAISEKNALFGLECLKKLLKEIVKNWPDVEFISTADLLKIVDND